MAIEFDRLQVTPVTNSPTTITPASTQTTPIVDPVTMTSTISTVDPTTMTPESAAMLSMMSHLLDTKLEQHLEAKLEHHLHPVVRMVDNNTKMVNTLKTKVEGLEKRTDRLEKQVRTRKNVIFNYPVDEWKVPDRPSIKDCMEAVRQFAIIALQVPPAEAIRIRFGDVKIWRERDPAKRTARVNVEFADLESQEIIWSRVQAGNLRRYNEQRIKAGKMRVGFDHDLPPAERELKKRKFESRNGRGEHRMDTQAKK